METEKPKNIFHTGAPGDEESIAHVIKKFWGRWVEFAINMALNVSLT
jgi:hypothetical protein